MLSTALFIECLQCPSFHERQLSRILGESEALSLSEERAAIREFVFPSDQLDWQSLANLAACCKSLYNTKILIEDESSSIYLVLRKEKLRWYVARHEAAAVLSRMASEEEYDRQRRDAEHDPHRFSLYCFSKRQVDVYGEDLVFAWYKSRRFYNFETIRFCSEYGSGDTFHFHDPTDAGSSAREDRRGPEAREGEPPSLDGVDSLLKQRCKRTVRNSLFLESKSKPRIVSAADPDGEARMNVNDAGLGFTIDDLEPAKEPLMRLYTAMREHYLLLDEPPPVDTKEQIRAAVRDVNARVSAARLPICKDTHTGRSVLGFGKPNVSSKPFSDVFKFPPVATDSFFRETFPDLLMQPCTVRRIGVGHDARIRQGRAITAELVLRIRECRQTPPSSCLPVFGLSSAEISELGDLVSSASSKTEYAPWLRCEPQDVHDRPMYSSGGPLLTRDFLPANLVSRVHARNDWRIGSTVCDLVISFRPVGENRVRYVADALSGNPTPGSVNERRLAPIGAYIACAADPATLTMNETEFMRYFAAGVLEHQELWHEPGSTLVSMEEWATSEPSTSFPLRKSVHEFEEASFLSKVFPSPSERRESLRGLDKAAKLELRRSGISLPCLSNFVPRIKIDTDLASYSSISMDYVVVVDASSGPEGTRRVRRATTTMHCPTWMPVYLPWTQGKGHRARASGWICATTPLRRMVDMRFVHLWTSELSKITTSASVLYLRMTRDDFCSFRKDEAAKDSKVLPHHDICKDLFSPVIRVCRTKDWIKVERGEKVSSSKTCIHIPNLEIEGMCGEEEVYAAPIVFDPRTLAIFFHVQRISFLDGFVLAPEQLLKVQNTTSFFESEVGKPMMQGMIDFLLACSPIHCFEKGRRHCASKTRVGIEPLSGRKAYSFPGDRELFLIKSHRSEAWKANMSIECGNERYSGSTIFFESMPSFKNTYGVDKTGGTFVFHGKTILWSDMEYDLGQTPVAASDPSLAVDAATLTNQWNSQHCRWVSSSSGPGHWACSGLCRGDCKRRGA